MSEAQQVPDPVVEQIRSSMSTLLEYVEAGAEFAAEQAPLVAQELIAWGFWDGVVGAVSSALVLMFGSYFFVKFSIGLSRAIKEDDDDGMFMNVLGLLPIVILWFFAACRLLCNVSTIIKASVAPRVYLIEKIAELVN